MLAESLSLLPTTLRRRSNSNEAMKPLVRVCAVNLSVVSSQVDRSSLLESLCCIDSGRQLVLDQPSHI
jgi:hypothetical protein